MAKQHFVKAARTDIYLIGKEVWRSRKTGKSKGLPYMLRDHSKSNDSTDKLVCCKGESYYWCKFRSDIGKRVSKVPFTSDQLKYGRYGRPEWETYWDDFYQRFKTMKRWSLES